MPSSTSSTAASDQVRELACKLELLRYHDLTDDHPALESFEDWMDSLSSKRDGGESKRGSLSTRNWLGYQAFAYLQTAAEQPLFDTYLQINNTGLANRTVTLCKDDRNVLANYGIAATGMWGLFIVHHYCRQQGQATRLAQAVDQLIQSTVNLTREPQSWVTFSGDPIAIKILKSVGFRYEREVTIHQPGYNNGEPSTETLFRRPYVSVS